MLGIASRYIHRGMGGLFLHFTMCEIWACFHTMGGMAFRL